MKPGSLFRFVDVLVFKIRKKQHSSTCFEVTLFFPILDINHTLLKFWKIHYNYFKIVKTEQSIIFLDENDNGQVLTELCSRKLLTPKSAVKIVTKLVRALRILHKFGITHGHLTTENIEVYMANHQVST